MCFKILIEYYIASSQIHNNSNNYVLTDIYLTSHENGDEKSKNLI